MDAFDWAGVESAGEAFDQPPRRSKARTRAMRGGSARPAVDAVFGQLADQIFRHAHPRIAQRDGGAPAVHRE